MSLFNKYSQFNLINQTCANGESVTQNETKNENIEFLTLTKNFLYVFFTHITGKGKVLENERFKNQYEPTKFR